MLPTIKCVLTLYVAVSSGVVKIISRNGKLMVQGSPEDLHYFCLTVVWAEDDGQGVEHVTEGNGESAEAEHHTLAAIISQDGNHTTFTDAHEHALESLFAQQCTLEHGY